MNKKIKQSELLVPYYLEFNIGSNGGLLQNNELLKTNETYYIQDQNDGGKAFEIVILTKLYSPLPPYTYSFEKTNKTKSVEFDGENLNDAIIGIGVEPEDLSDFDPELEILKAKGETVVKEVIEEIDIEEILKKPKPQKEVKAEDLPFPEVVKEEPKEELEELVEEEPQEETEEVDLFVDVKKDE